MTILIITWMRAQFGKFSIVQFKEALSTVFLLACNFFPNFTLIHATTNHYCTYICVLIRVLHTPSNTVQYFSSGAEIEDVSSTISISESFVEVHIVYTYMYVHMCKCTEENVSIN